MKDKFVKTPADKKPHGLGKIMVGQQDGHASADGQTHSLWEGESQQVREMGTYQQTRELTSCGGRITVGQAHISRQENSLAVGGRITAGQQDGHTSADKRTHGLWEGEWQHISETATHQQTRELTSCGRENCGRSARQPHNSTRENSRAVGGRMAAGQRDGHTSADERTHELWEGEWRQVSEMDTHQQTRELTSCERENCSRSARRAHISRRENSLAVGGRIAACQRDGHTSADERTHSLWEGESRHVSETGTHQQTRELTRCGRENRGTSAKRAHTSRRENSLAVGGRIAPRQRDGHTPADERTHSLWEGESRHVSEMSTHQQTRELTGCGRENHGMSAGWARISRRENSQAVGGRIAAYERTHGLWEGESQHVSETGTHQQQRELTGCGRENRGTSARWARISRRENSLAVGGRITARQRDGHTSADERTHELWEEESRHISEMGTHQQTRELMGCGRKNRGSSVRWACSSRGENSHCLG
ncbi:hypothetical protein K438DRAFT_1785939 [Mycena galopus ATCC 62051]|nr:hypothetical protein K438DRAFT_1785939 [Mycena galopus ATCC 62051]